jgi:hypothetical protein
MWRYEPETRTIRSVPSNHWVASMNSWDGAEDHQANARIIAAAPELLEALNSMIDLAEFWINHRQERHMSEEQYRVWLALGHESNAMIKARAAIARATGGQ